MKQKRSIFERSKSPNFTLKVRTWNKSIYLIRIRFLNRIRIPFGFAFRYWVNNKLTEIIIMENFLFSPIYLHFSPHWPEGISAPFQSLAVKRAETDEDSLSGTKIYKKSFFAFDTAPSIYFWKWWWSSGSYAWLLTYRFLVRILQPAIRISWEPTVWICALKGWA